ncbi:DUF6950 family protein [Pseudooceanicola nanhaiensis]|uniref:DUF6950 family protein n=1 Tax=Pseudooceanicola nanhaiensis TaxID=375761 RepID=UPI003518973B
MKRLSDWRSRLAAYIAVSFERPLRPGRFDCALFAAGAIEAMTGEDPAADWRGSYSTIEGGISALRAAGHTDHVAFAAALFDEVPVAHARLGDLAVVPEGDRAGLGVVQGARVYVLHISGGLGTVPLIAAERAFRV